MVDKTGKKEYTSLFRLGLWLHCNLDDDAGQRLNEHPEFAPRLRALLKELSAPKPATQHPPINEWFDLTVDNTIDPMLVVTTGGYNGPGWKFLGPKFESKIYRVRLIELGYVANLQAAREAAMVRGYRRLLEGQAREALKVKFPRHNGRPIVFGGNEWRDPDGDRGVADLGGLGGGSWGSHFRWSGRDFRGRWLWAVVEQLASIPRYFGGVCFSSCLIQPPIMRPISFNGSENKVYFEVFNCLISQAICKKNFKVSTLPAAFWT